MPKTISIKLALCVFAAAFTCIDPAAAQSEGGFVDTIGSLLDTVKRVLDAVGEESEKLLPPTTPPLQDIHQFDTGDLDVSQRLYQDTFPAGPDMVVQVVNEFGEVRVESWEEPVVSVEADILAGAETKEVASTVANAIRVNIEQAEGRLGLRTVYPDTREYGNVLSAVNYSIRVPSGISLLVENTFGDTFIRGISGNTALDARYGLVTLEEMGGAVNARARGDFPFAVRGLEQGGNFELYGSAAEFHEVQGDVIVDVAMGEASLYPVNGPASVTLRGSSSEVHVYVDDPLPELDATIIYGKLHSEVDLEQISRQSVVRARSRTGASNRSIEVFTSFDDVHVHAVSETVARSEAGVSGLQDVQGFVQKARTLDTPLPIRIEALPGNITVQASSESELLVEGTQLLRIRRGQPTLPALDALELEVTEEQGQLVIRTRTGADMNALGVPYYRVDLALACPPGNPVAIVSGGGQHDITGLQAGLSIETEQGSVRVGGVQGEVNVVNRGGDVTLVESGGPVTVSASAGTVLTQGVPGAQTISCTGGRVIVEAPFGGIVLRGTGADAKIIALDGIHGAYDIRLEEGDISLLRPGDAYPDFLVTVNNGDVNSQAPLTGSIEGPRRQFRGLNSNIEHEVRLETVNGNVTID